MSGSGDIGASVLIVEDEIIVQRHLRRLVERLGHRVVGTAADGAAALEIARRERPDLVLMDIRLRGAMDGVEVAQALRLESEIAVVFLTAFADAATLERTGEVEAAGYVVKPFEESDVQAALSTALAKEQAAQRLAEHGRDLTSILDQLEVGAAMVDADGRLSFLSRPAARWLGCEPGAARGLAWTEVLGLGGAERRAQRLELERLAAAPAGERRRFPLTLPGERSRRRYVEIDVRDDPRGADKRVFFLYDVTDARQLRHLLEEEVRSHGMVGRSPVMTEVFRHVDQVASAAAPVFIEGETGTGKELVARAIHRASPRSAGPFVAVNCAGLTESLLASQLFGQRRGSFTGAVADHRGFFESAHGGTLFLDEIGDISMSVQTSLLRVLEDGRVTPLGAAVSKQVDVRIVTATHRDLQREVDAGRFRADLVYRIRVARAR
ncbi:MAG: sigma 54-interacting transcriptional regulator, partial [Acidobacteriota bacterium]